VTFRLPVPRYARLLAASALLCACDELGEFHTEPGEVFHGEVIGSTAEADTPSFIREGFVSHTEMDLTFDPTLAISPPPNSGKMVPEAAGTLDTYLCPPETDLCAKSKREAGPFQHASLEVIERLNHDALSQYDFPGGGRLRNYILGVHFDADVADAGTLDRNALVFLSLMDNGQVEVRVLAGSVRVPDGSDELPALFGVFVLNRHKP
jgi:hypothetical protein